MLQQRLVQKGKSHVTTIKAVGLLGVAVAYVKIIQKTNFGMFRLFLVSW